MKLKAGMLIGFMLVTTMWSGTVSCDPASPQSVTGGWLEERDGVTILHISGTNYEMGLQHGSLLKEPVQQDIRAFLAYSPVPYSELLSIWDVMKDYVPAEYIEELHGLADGAEIPYEDLVAANMVVVVGDMACFGISAWGNATADGRLYHARSFDQPFDIQDPVSGRFAHENAVLVVRVPADGYASVAPSIAGSMHGGGGINDHGIAVGQQVCWSRDQTFHGMPGQFRVLQVLDHAATGEEALAFLTSNREMGWNFIVSDAGNRTGYAVETTANLSYAGTDDDPVEGTEPFWVIDDVVRRTNFFIEPSTAASQRDVYDPSGLLSFLKLVRRTDVFFAVWRSYKVVSEGIEDGYGDLSLNGTMAMLRACYSGRTDLLLRLIVYLAEGTSFNRAWNMWVACPETGELVVSFATRDTIAFDTTVHYFVLDDLVTATPP